MSCCHRIRSGYSDDSSALEFREYCGFYLVVNWKCPITQLFSEVKHTMCGGQHTAIDLRCLLYASWDLTAVDLTGLLL